MQTDEERREVAARLRNEAESWRNYREDDNAFCMNDSEFTEAVLEDFGFTDMDMPAYEVFDQMADLIDRPTCQNKQIFYNRTAPKEFRTDNFTCSACGETFCADGDWVNHPIDWAFCPNCGAEVVE